MFLVGGFSESKYLQKRIKQEFQHIIRNISVPSLPMAAISRGATIRSNLNNLGNNNSVISSRILKFTYGCDMWRKWVSSFNLINFYLLVRSVTKDYIILRKVMQMSGFRPVKMSFLICQ